MMVKYVESCKFKIDLRIYSKKSSTFAAQNEKLECDRTNDEKENTIDIVGNRHGDICAKRGGTRYYCNDKEYCRQRENACVSGI